MGVWGVANFYGRGNLFEGWQFFFCGKFFFLHQSIGIDVAIFFLGRGKLLLGQSIGIDE